MERSKEDQFQDIMESHTGFGILDAIHGGSFNKGSLMKKEPGDKNAKLVKKLKKPIEKQCMIDRVDKVNNFFIDVLEHRAKEVLDPKLMPITKLADLTIKLIPKQLEVKATVEHGFMSLYDTIDEEDDDEESSKD